jgi:hypothetical protein
VRREYLHRSSTKPSEAADLFSSRCWYLPIVALTLRLQTERHARRQIDDPTIRLHVPLVKDDRTLYPIVVHRLERIIESAVPLIALA